MQPGIKILIFSKENENTYAISYIKAGANCYLSKLSGEEEIKNTINKVINSVKWNNYKK